MKNLLKMALASGALALSQPGLAQEPPSEAEQSAKVMEMLSKMFVAEPLTDEQNARLPAASEAVARMMPEGFYGEMMSGMMDRIIGPMFDALGTEMIEGQIKKQVGLYSWELPELDETQLEEISKILDPVADERMELITTGMIDGMMGMFVKLEPAMREGVSRAYAVRFSSAELADINAFFATSTGGKYASESMLLMADPQVMSGMMQAMPAIMEDMPALMESLKEQEAKLPKPNGHDDLTPAERSRLAKLLGLSASELEGRMAEAAASEEAAANPMLVEED